MKGYRLRNVVVTAPCGEGQQVEVCAYVASPEILSRKLTASGVNQIEALKALLLEFLKSEFSADATFVRFELAWAKTRIMVKLTLQIGERRYQGKAEAVEIPYAIFAAFQNACPAFK